MAGPLPLLGLRAFAESGRALSMKAAAHRLGVTPGAVSQQIKLLEARLGVALFERGNHTLLLTQAGRDLLAGVGAAFEQIEQAFQAATHDEAGRQPALTVSTTGAFAAAWLVPRLGAFVARHPGISVQILTTQELVSLEAGAGRADVAIRHGLGDWPRAKAIPLLRPRLLPVGSPGLLAKGPPIRRPADCLRYKLLHDPLAADWHLWLRAMEGTDGALPERAAKDASRGTRFADSVLLMPAAVAGQGLALLRDTYAMDEIAGGRLEVAFDAPWPAQFAYYVVTARGDLPPRVQAFRQWLLSEAAAEADHAVPIERVQLDCRRQNAPAS
jgi:LysR family transcriptional regulator, glycine cleavage system transcriptional activator